MLLSKAEGKYPITGSTRSPHDLHQKALEEEKKSTNMKQKRTTATTIREGRIMLSYIIYNIRYYSRRVITCVYYYLYYYLTAFYP